MWFLYVAIVILTSPSTIHSYVIEGSVIVPPDAPSDWFVNSRIHVDGGLFVGFVKQDGSFEVSDVPSGSYMVEIINPTYYFQNARVDISSKGRIRARRVNAPQPNAVKELTYPLRMSTLGKAAYFKPREQMRTIDLLFNPNVLYVLVPLLFVMLLTKLVNTSDPELQKEMQNMNILGGQQQIPDMSELLSSISLFGGGNASTTSGRKQNQSGNGKRKITSGEKSRYSYANTDTCSPCSSSSSTNNVGSTTTTHRKTSKIQKG